MPAVSALHNLLPASFLHHRSCLALLYWPFINQFHPSALPRRLSSAGVRGCPASSEQNLFIEYLTIDRSQKRKNHLATADWEGKMPWTSRAESSQYQWVSVINPTAICASHSTLGARADDVQQHSLLGSSKGKGFNHRGRQVTYALLLPSSGFLAGKGNFEKQGVLHSRPMVK